MAEWKSGEAYTQTCISVSGGYWSQGLLAARTAGTGSNTKPLTQQDSVDQLNLCGGPRLQGLKALYPPEGGADSVEIVASDLSRLDETEFLNDTIIDFFIK